MADDESSIAEEQRRQEFGEGRREGCRRTDRDGSSKNGRSKRVRRLECRVNGHRGHAEVIRNRIPTERGKRRLPSDGARTGINRQDPATFGDYRWLAAQRCCSQEGWDRGGTDKPGWQLLTGGQQTDLEVAENRIVDPEVIDQPKIGATVCVDVSGTEAECDS